MGADTAGCGRADRRPARCRNRRTANVIAFRHLARAIRWFGSSHGRQLYQLGRLGDAAATLEGLLRADEHVVGLSVVDVAGLVALGRVALHTGDARLTAEMALLAKPVLDSPAPGLRRHAA
jgi:hypothetical protein